MPILTGPAHAQDEVKNSTAVNDIIILFIVVPSLSKLNFN
jgi:hypothetical protein